MEEDLDMRLWAVGGALCLAACGGEPFGIVGSLDGGQPLAVANPEASAVATEAGQGATDDAMRMSSLGDAGPDAGGPTEASIEASTGADIDAGQGPVDAAHVDAAPNVRGDAGVTLTFMNAPVASVSTMEIEGYVSNDGTTNGQANQVSVRWWFNADGCPVNGLLLNPGAGASATAKRMADIGMAVTPHADSFVEFTFPSTIGSPNYPAFPPGSTLPVNGHVQTTSNACALNPNNDWSYETGHFSTFVPWSHVTVYVNGALVWGVEPNASTDP